MGSVHELEVVNKDALLLNVSAKRWDRAWCDATNFLMVTARANPEQGLRARTGVVGAPLMLGFVENWSDDSDVWNVSPSIVPGGRSKSNEFLQGATSQAFLQ